MRTLPYDRAAAVAYARRWALGRNPAYYNFDPLGGDCTNFISQCLYAGSGQMNYTPVTGWYYITADRRTAAWTGVPYLQRFLLTNGGAGPFARAVSVSELQPGDVIQLADAGGGFYHSLLVTAVSPQILVAAHTMDALDRPLASYGFAAAQYLHIAGVRRP